MKYSITFSDLSASEAQHLLAQAGGQASGGAPAPAAAAPVAPVAPQAPSAPPVPAAPQAAAPPPPAAPPAAAAPPPAAAPAAPANVPGARTVQAVLAQMQEYAKIHKAAGAKAVLAQCNLTKATDANQEQLNWLWSAFGGAA